jgi:glycosyltransferase involved in cell wall biosynthesis
LGKLKRTILKKNIYIYPLSSRDEKLGLFNPYIDDLINSLSENFHFVNREKPSQKGILDILKYLPKLDYIHFNWIEKLPGNKFGTIQTRLLYSLMPIFKTMGIKIIWTMHNKLSHTGQDDKKTMALFKLMLKKADLILTHSSAGIHYGEELIPGVKDKIIYMPHPVKNRRLKIKTEIKYDVLIWGTISPYKGIDQFLQFIYDHNQQDQFRILIVGKASDKNYFEKLQKFQNKVIEIRNEFIDTEDLARMISESKSVLFTYSKASILSSGVLMDSLGFGAHIIGPEVGAFADLSKENIIRTFKNFEDAIKIIEKESRQPDQKGQTKLNQFLAENSWPVFGKKFALKIQQLD